MKIYIYLSKSTKSKLKEIQEKYRISLSTMAQILSDYFRPNLKLYEDKFFTEYLDKEHRYKTTIKPNNTKETSEFFNAIKNETSTASHVLSNLLYKYAEEEYQYLYHNYTDDKVKTKYPKEITKLFFEAKDDLWDYNEWIRKQIKREVKGHNTLQKYKERYSA